MPLATWVAPKKTTLLHNIGMWLIRNLLDYFLPCTKFLTSPKIALGTGKSSIVLRPADAFITSGIILTHIAIVAIPPGISGLI
jgi:hypothetical protein